jgi:hypothetical protein
MSPNVPVASPATQTTPRLARNSLETSLETYAFRRFGRESGAVARLSAALYRHPGQLGAPVIEPMARDREVILLESAGVGRSTGSSWNRMDQLTH